MILEDGREIRVGARIEVWDAGRCLRVLRPTSAVRDLRHEEGALRDGDAIDWDIRDVFVSLRDLVLLVVGGTRGIGRALGAACAARGAEVIAVGRAECDVTDAAAVDAFFSRHPHIDVVVQCAALPGGAFADVLETNVTGAFHVARTVLARGGRSRFVAVSSGVTDTAVAGAAGYVTSKHALEGLVRALARDAERTEVTFTAVQLGACPTPEVALPALLAAIVAPAGEVHGRVLGGAPEPRSVDTSEASAFASAIGASPRAVDAMAHVRNLHRYPDVHAAELRAAIAAKHDVAFERFVVGAGASDLLERGLRVLGRRGESIVANGPTWPLFPELCRRVGLVPRRVAYRIDREARRIDHALDAVLAEVDRATHLVYLVSPSNPFGVAIDRQPFARFLDALPAHVNVIVDEAWADYVERPDALRAIDAARKDERVIVLRSFSKLHGLAALRVGWAFASPVIATRLANAGLPFAVSALAQAAAVAALSDDEHAERVRAASRDDRRRSDPSAFPSDAPFFFTDDGE